MRNSPANIGRQPALLQGLLGGAGFAAETLAEVLVIAQLGPAWMPVGLAGAAAISLGLTALFMHRPAGRYRLIGLAGMATVVGVAVWGLMWWAPAVAALIFLLASRPLRDALSVATSNAITARYDPQAAKQAWPRLAAIAQIGAIVTGIALPLLLRIGGTQAAVIVWPILTGAALIVAHDLSRTRRMDITAPTMPSLPSTPAQPARRFRHASLLRTLSITAMLAVMTGAALGLTAAMLLSAAVRNPVRLASLYVTIGVLSNVGVLGVQTLVLPRLLRRVGTARAALLPPTLAAGIATSAIIGGGLAGGLAAQAGRLVLRPALQTPIEEILLGLLPVGERGAGRAWLRGGAIPVAGLISSLSLAAFAADGARPPMVAGVALFSALGGLVAALVLRRQHRQAALALAREQDPRAQRMLLPSFGALDTDIKQEIVRKLDGTDRDDERLLLIALLADVDPAAAALAVAERIAHATPDHAAVLLSTLAEHRCPTTALVSSAPLLLTSPVASVRRATLAALAMEPSLPTSLVVPLLDDPDPAVTLLAVERLMSRQGRLPAHAADRLATLVRADNAAIRAATAPLVAKMAPDMLVTLLHDPSHDVRHAATRAVAELPRVPEALMPALREAMSDEAASVRAGALTTLSRQGPSAAPVLLAALDDPAARVRLVAANALLEGGRRYIAPLSRYITTSHGWSRALGLAILSRRTAWRWQPALLAQEREGLACLEKLAAAQGDLGIPESPVAGLLYRDVSDEIARGLAHWQETLTITDGASAAGTIQRGLTTEEARARSHALEALEAARSPELARQASRLLDSHRDAAQRHDGECDMHPLKITPAAREVLTAGADPWRQALLAAVSNELGDHRGCGPVTQRNGKDVMMLSLVERATLLRGVPPFADLPSDQLRLLAEVTKEIEVAHGETLITAGSGGEHLYVVITGQVALEDTRGASGSVARIGTLGPGDALGEDAVFDGGTHIVHATAVTDCQLLTLERDVLLALLEEQPSLARALIAWLSARLRETSGKLAERTKARPRAIINLLDQLGDTNTT